MRRLLLTLLALLSALSGCAAPGGAEEEGRLSVVTTTYPLYLFASAVTQGVDGVDVERLSTGSGSCLHDYTLSVTDMKKIERAGLLVLNGAGLEDFMSGALAASGAAVVDCSQGVDLLENPAHDHPEGEGDHDHGHWDPHYWMDPRNAARMVDGILDGLCAADPDNAQAYQDNAQAAVALLNRCHPELQAALEESQAEIGGLVTFHDGFQYFARAFDLPLLAAIEEEAGSEASAREIVEITRLVREKELPVIFTEVNGSDATARAIARETGCAVGELTMLMDGPDSRLENYTQGMWDNILAVVDGFAGEEGLS